MIVYQADAKTCNACPLRATCTESDRGRQVHRSFDEAYLELVRSYHDTDAYKKAMRKRKVWVEPLFGEGKAWHGMERFRLRLPEKVNIEALVRATGQNLKRLLSWRGWGRRWWPGGAVGVVIPARFGRIPRCRRRFSGRWHARMAVAFLQRPDFRYGGGAGTGSAGVFQQAEGFSEPGDPKSSEPGFNHLCSKP